MTTTTRTHGLSSNALKLIAITAMTIDHLTSVIFPGYPTHPGIILLHTIGRLAMPIMCFFIAEGYYYTHNLKKYIARLFIFSIISHFAYNFAFGIPFIPFQTTVFNQTSMFWGLGWGLVAVALHNSKNPKLKDWMKTALTYPITLIAFCADWSAIGVLVILNNAKHRGNFRKQMTTMMFWICAYAIVYFLLIDKVYGLLQLTAAFAIPLLKRYNGTRGNWTGLKWFFYMYYPLHLILCGIIRIMLHGNIGVMIGA